jgi:hypothetical protein
VLARTELDRYEHAIFLRGDGGTDLTREDNETIERMRITDRGPARVVRDNHTRASSRLFELDLEPVARVAFAQSRLKSPSDQEFEPGSIELTLWPALFHENAYTAPLGVCLKFPTDGTHDCPNRHVVAPDDRKQRCRVAQLVGDELVQRLRVPCGHGPEVRIHARFVRYAVVIHERQHALDGAKWIPKVVTQMAEPIAQCVCICLHVPTRRGQ